MHSASTMVAAVENAILRRSGRTRRNPRSPILRRSIPNRQSIPPVPAMVVAKARPLTPINLRRIRLSTMFAMTTPMETYMVVLVSRSA